MTQEEWAKFLDDLSFTMQLRYTPEEAAIIVEWFKYIKAADELALIGRERFDGMMAFTELCEGWSLYNMTMARAWVYAPFILAEAKAKQ